MVVLNLLLVLFYYIVSFSFNTLFASMSDILNRLRDFLKYVW